MRVGLTRNTVYHNKAHLILRVKRATERDYQISPARLSFLAVTLVLVYISEKFLREVKVVVYT